MTGEKILVVEDETIIAFNLQRVLTGFGYQAPETVGSGWDAIRAAETLQPDLILMDIQLRGEMDGIETARRIGAFSDVPVIYVTAFAEDTRLAQASLTAPYGYLVKPVQERELRAAIEMALFKHCLDQRLEESEEAYRELYHNTPAMLHTTDPDGIITQVSDYWLNTFGYTRDEVIGKSILDFLTPASRKFFTEQAMPDLYHNGSVRDSECQVLTSSGRVIDVLFSTICVYGSQGNLTHALSALVDITARKRIEADERDQRALAEALRDTAAALNSTLRFEEVVDRVLTNVSRVVHYDMVNIMLMDANEELARIVASHGYAEIGEEGEAYPTPFKPHELPYLRAMIESLQPLAIPDASQLDPRQPDWFRSYAGAPIVVKGKLVGFINLIGRTLNFFTAEHANRLQAFADQAAIAIENARLYAEVQRLASVDELTGVNNRRKLFETGQHEFERARRYGTSLAAILLDIDRFKKINDTYGHTTGDQVLAGIASTISRNVRNADLFGRYGGEEFVVLLPLADRERALEVAERLRALVAGLRFETERGTLEVTISLGVAMFTPRTHSLATLIDWADQAMYAAKQAGRNRVEIYA